MSFQAITAQHVALAVLILAVALASIGMNTLNGLRLRRFRRSVETLAEQQKELMSIVKEETVQ